MQQGIPRLSTRLLIGSGFLAAVLLIGTIGFVILEGWSLLESFFTTLLIVSTLGFSDLRPVDTYGRALTIVLILAGVGTLYYIAVTLAQSAIENQFGWGRRRQMDQQIARMRDHVIVCGYGRVGRETCRSLARHGAPFLVIDSDPARLATIQADGYLALNGDASDDATLIRAGIARARALLTAVQSDAANVYITLSARALNPSLLIIARAATTEAEHKLRIAGASKVISPYVLGGRSMASMALQPAVMDFLDLLMHSDDADTWLEELVIGPDSALQGMRVDETNLRERAGMTILAVWRADGRMLVNPPPDTILKHGDTLIVLGSRAAADRMGD